MKEFELTVNIELLQKVSTSTPDYYIILVVYPYTYFPLHLFILETVDCISNAFCQLKPLFLSDVLINLLFSPRKENITLPEVEDIALPPAFVLRLIILYGRSYCMPQMSPDAKQVCMSPYISPDA